MPNVACVRSHDGHPRAASGVSFTNLVVMSGQRSLEHDHFVRRHLMHRVGNAPNTVP